MTLKQILAYGYKLNPIIKFPETNKSQIINQTHARQPKKKKNEF